MAGSDTHFSDIVKRVRHVLDVDLWPAPLRVALRALGCTLAYLAALLLSAVWISGALAALASPLLDLGKPHVGTAIIVFARYLSLSPEGIFMLAHTLVGIKLALGTFLLMAVSAGIYGRLRGAAGDAALDVALFLSAIASVVAAIPVLTETIGLHQIVGELMLCVIASTLIGAAQAPLAADIESRTDFAAAESV
jgi:hypothetical protein